MRAVRCVVFMLAGLAAAGATNASNVTLPEFDTYMVGETIGGGASADALGQLVTCEWGYDIEYETQALIDIEIMPELADYHHSHPTAEGGGHDLPVGCPASIVVTGKGTDVGDVGEHDSGGNYFRTWVIDIDGNVEMGGDADGKQHPYEILPNGLRAGMAEEPLIKLAAPDLS